MSSTHIDKMRSAIQGYYTQAKQANTQIQKKD